jgi:hypothetical protein
MGLSRMVLSCAVGAAATLVAAGAASAVSTSFWRVDSFDDLAAGEPSGTSVLSEGSLVLSPDHRRTEVPDASYVWSAVPGPRGVAYLVAGTPGRLFELSGGELTLLFEDATADFPALAVGYGGDLFVGTAPGGQVHRVHPDGASELFHDTGQGYVWSMAYSREHGLLVGTGSPARVLSLDARGEAHVVYESGESSVTVLACVGDRVLAGTSGSGLLVDVTPGRDAAVLFDAPSEEISAAARSEDGEVYFASASVSLADALDRDTGSGSTMGEGAVWRTTPAGGVVGLWDSPDVPITALGNGPGGAVWAGTGAKGTLVSVGPRGKSDLVASLDAEEVLSIVGSGGQTLVATGAPGTVYAFGQGVAASGSYESGVFEGGSACVWGEMRWRAEEPDGARVALFTRSGNTAEPDETWSEWAPVEDAGHAQGPVRSRPAQNLQWKAALERGSGGESPVLHSVEVAYLEENLPPRLGSLVVHDPGSVETDAGPGAGPATQTLPGGLEITYSIDPARAGARDLPLLLRGMRAAEWEAMDPNDDRLIYSVWIRSEDETVWRLLEKDIERTAHAWDTASMTDGFYRVKVVVTDRLDNAPERAGADSLASAPFLVDGTPPAVADLDVKAGGGRVTVSGGVRDLLSPVDRVEVAVDYGEWKSAFAEDGLFDSPDERFRILLDDVGAGEHTVAVRATDRAGNSAAVTRVVR